MVHSDELFRTATIDLLSTLARIDENGCAAIKEHTTARMVLVENFLKRELEVLKRIWVLPTFPNAPLMWATILSVTLRFL